MVDTPTAPALATSPVETPAPTPAASDAAFDWSKSGLDADNLGYVQSKNFKDPAALAGSYRNLEKLIGVPPDQVLKLPQDDLPASWDPVFAKLGRPEKADGYTLPVPEGVDPGFAKTASTWFHEAGLSQKQAKAVTEKWNAFAGDQAKVQTEQAQARDKEQLTALQGEWGPQNMQANSAIVDRAAAEFGMAPDMVDALKASMGAGNAMKFLYNIGLKLGTEGEFIGSDGKPVSTGGLSPDAARTQIAELRKDREFVKRYANGGAVERAELDRLHRVAYPSS
jgi:hypothetical protein